jgi:hypothetical protein
VAARLALVPSIRAKIDLGLGGLVNCEVEDDSALVHYGALVDVSPERSWGDQAPSYVVEPQPLAHVMQVRCRLHGHDDPLHLRNGRGGTAGALVRQR